ncbi:sigma-70 family RNA polymerase sigma factor [Kocuria rhizophila]|uniref:sigma-70 family RNA polymerase sigma factor n=1 Tax=Kocuria rhizophila TaxID=72000 RepID=UPI0011A2BF18|nr:sigma-70 family RNA polymerase sigma factor [Kocuria rhizophila]
MPDSSGSGPRDPGVHTEHPASDEQLLTAVREGDSSAFAELYERHRGAVLAVARMHSRNDADAQDLVSEAFTRVLGLLREGRGPRQFLRAYLVTAVSRLAADRANDLTRTRPEAPQPNGPLDRVELFDDLVVKQVDSAVVAQAFASLPERWQEILWYLEVEGRRPRQVASVVGVQPNAVSALGKRAREGLRTAYMQEHVSAQALEDCYQFSSQLGAFARGALTPSRTAVVQDHLDGCRRCTAEYLQLQDLGFGLRGWMLPALAGLPLWGGVGGRLAESLGGLPLLGGSPALAAAGGAGAGTTGVGGTAGVVDAAGAAAGTAGTGGAAGTGAAASAAGSSAAGSAAGGLGAVLGSSTGLALAVGAVLVVGASTAGLVALNSGSEEAPPTAAGSAEPGGAGSRAAGEPGRQDPASGAPAQGAAPGGNGAAVPDADQAQGAPGAEAAQDAAVERPESTALPAPFLPDVDPAIVDPVPDLPVSVPYPTVPRVDGDPVPPDPVDPEPASPDPVSPDPVEPIPSPVPTVPEPTPSPGGGGATPAPTPTPSDGSCHWVPIPWGIEVCIP